MEVSDVRAVAAVVVALAVAAAAADDAVVAGLELVGLNAPTPYVQAALPPVSR